MTGIAIMLGTKADGEAIDRIEKLIGHKIPRAGKVAEAEPAAEAAKAAERPKPVKAAKPAKPAPKRAAVAKTEPADHDDTPQAERSPVVEDIASEWNGPMPSFLSVSAG
jgi:superfamily II DNA/RNA helicase